MKRYILIILACVAVAVYASDDDRMLSYTQNLETYAEFLKKLNTHYVDTIDIDKVTQAGISAMLAQLDPYTTYFSEEEAREFEEQSTGEYAGVGCTIVQRDSGVYISQPFEGTPAQMAGLRAGDKIVMIDNDSVLHMKSDEVSKRMRGLPNTQLRMVLDRPGSDSLVVVNITRQIIQHNPVVYYGVVSDSVGYIMLETFSQQAAEEVRKAFVSLREESHITSLILDVRENGGGLVSEAVEIVNMFVPRGTTVLNVRSKTGKNNHVYKAERVPVDTVIPLAVLINERTASASEVVAGSLQDLDRCVVVGERSFGKGLVQQTFDLPYNRQVKLTTAHYYIPSGRCIQALDYSRRDDSGRAIRVPDSLTHEFLTAHGRVVRDGGGIMPDIKVKDDTISNLHYYLLMEHVISDYVTCYVLEHDSIAPARQFEITDADYNDFKDFVMERGFKYDKISSKVLDDLREAMTFEGYMDAQGTLLIDSLSHQLEHNVYKDLDTFRSEIATSLAQEIAQRYYFRRGYVEVGLRDDPVMQAAVEVLLSSEQYRKILAPNQ